MAIIIHPKQIYDLDNDKVIDNEITGVEYTNGAKIRYNYENAIESTPAPNIDGIFVYTNPIDKDNFLDNNITLELYSSSFGDFIIGTFDYDVIRYSSKGYLKISPDSEPFVSVMCDNEKEIGNELLQYNSISNLKSNINEYTKVIGGIISSVNVDVYNSFNIKSKYCFAIKKSEISSYFQVFYGASADVYYIMEDTQKQSVGTDINHSLNTNELIQDTTKKGTDSIGTFLSNKILDDYKNGKETIINLKLSINEYYDENGELKISIKDNSLPMVFSIGDIVIPYKTTANGEAPISRYMNNNPKKFKVIGVSFEFDGAVWQILELQEINE